MTVFLNKFDALKALIVSNDQNCIQQLKSIPSGRKIFQEGKNPLQQLEKAKNFVALKGWLILGKELFDRGERKLLVNVLADSNISISKKVKEKFIQKDFKVALDESVEYLEKHWSSELHKESLLQIPNLTRGTQLNKESLKVNKIITVTNRIFNSCQLNRHTLSKLAERVSPIPGVISTLGSAFSTTIVPPFLFSKAGTGEEFYDNLYKTTAPSLIFSEESPQPSTRQELDDALYKCTRIIQIAKELADFTSKQKTL